MVVTKVFLTNLIEIFFAQHDFINEVMSAIGFSSWHSTIYLRKKNVTTLFCWAWLGNLNIYNTARHVYDFFYLILETTFRIRPFICLQWRLPQDKSPQYYHYYFFYSNKKKTISLFQDTFKNTSWNTFWKTRNCNTECVLKALSRHLLKESSRRIGEQQILSWQKKLVIFKKPY